MTKEERKKYNKEYRDSASAGVYFIKNTKSDKYYIGQSQNYKARWLNHQWHLQEHRHYNKNLQEDYKVYGKDAFVFELIEELPYDTPRDILLEKEKQQIEKHMEEGRLLYNFFYASPYDSKKPKEGIMLTDIELNKLYNLPGAVDLKVYLAIKARVCPISRISFPTRATIRKDIQNSCSKRSITESIRLLVNIGLLERVYEEDSNIWKFYLPLI